MSPRFLILGLSTTLVGYAVYQAMKTPAIDTTDGQGSGWSDAINPLLDVAYQFTGGNMEISLAGLYALKQNEGFRANVYKDSAGFATIGYGHKLTLLENYTTISEADATRLLAKDITNAEDAINSLVKVPLKQNQFDALVSFVFNVGTGAFRRSTMLSLLNAGNYTGAAGQFGSWNKATVNGAKVAISGITARRAREAQFFLA